MSKDKLGLEWIWQKIMPNGGKEYGDGGSDKHDRRSRNNST